MLEQEARHAHAARGVELRVDGVGREEAVRACGPAPTAGSGHRAPRPRTRRRPSGVQICTQRSIPFDSTTPSASDARNLAGIVSRFLASRVWSKVPRKAIGHLACPASRGALPAARGGSGAGRGRWTRTEVEEWEEPLHPGPLPTLLPHILPLSNPSCTSSPTVVLHLTRRDPESPCSSGIARWETVAGRGGGLRNAALRNARSAARLAAAEGFRPPGVPAGWGVVGGRGSARRRPSASPPGRANRGVRPRPRGYDGPTMPTHRPPPLAPPPPRRSRGARDRRRRRSPGARARPAPAADRTRPRPSRPRLRSTPRRSSRAAGRSSRTLRPRSGRSSARPTRRAQVVALFDQGGVQFARDVEPWLGDRVGAAALTLGRGGDKIVVAASRDDAAATAALGRIAARRERALVPRRLLPRRRRSARPSAAAGVVGDAVVFGSENGLKAADRRVEGLVARRGATQLKEARATVRQERSGFLYVDVAGFLRQALGAPGGGRRAARAVRRPGRPGAAQDRRRRARRRARPASASTPPRSATAAAPAPAGSGADALAALPGDAWLGLGVGELGQTVNGFIDRVSSGGGLAGVGVQALLGQAQQGLGLDIRRDLLAWMGDAGVFVAGDVGRHAPRRARRRVEGPGRDAARRPRARDARAPQRRRVAPCTARGVDEGFAVEAPRRQAGPARRRGRRPLRRRGRPRSALDEALSPERPPRRRARRSATPPRSSARGVRPVVLRRRAASSAALAGSRQAAATARELRERLEAFGAVVGGGRRDGDVTRGEAVATRCS